MRDAAEAGDREGHDALERVATRATAGTYLSFDDQLCPYDPCPAVVNELLVLRDSGHLTATYSRQMAPSLAAAIGAALRLPPPARGGSTS